MSQINITRKTVIIPANGSVTRAMTGKYILVLAATAPFGLSIDGVGENVSIPVGLAIPTGTEFKNLVFTDQTGNGTTVDILTSDTLVDYFPILVTTIVKDAPTYSKGAGVLNIGAGLSVPFTGVDAANTNNQRKQIVVTNLDAANNLQITDVAGNVMSTIFPQQKDTLVTNASLKVKNPNGGATQAVVGETFYV